MASSATQKPEEPTINHLDYREWLGQHGAKPFLLDSALMRAFYNLIFAYPGGNSTAPGNVEAGTQLNLVLVAMQYRGALMWKMNAGMGDVVFAPLYEVLRRRGVKFAFFHQVTGLYADGTDAVQRVTVMPQVHVTDGAPYNPLFDVKGLPCWPDRPLFEQLVEGAALRDSGDNLESFWTAWKPSGPEKTLRAGVDFDKVIMAIPTGAHPYLCRDLMDTSARWRRMVGGLGTTETQALQLWFHPDLVSLGWTLPSPVVGSYAATSMENWADTSQVIDREDWPPGTVGSLAYLCGNLVGPAVAPPPETREFPGQRLEVVRQTSLTFLEHQISPFWPKAVADAGQGNGMRWDLLVAPTHARGPARFGYQFVRSNIDPSERYVQSLVGSSRFRMKTDVTDFNNLYVAGDWIDQGLNVGCIEGTAISGRQAARAISGRDMWIPHETSY